MDMRRGYRVHGLWCLHIKPGDLFWQRDRCDFSALPWTTSFFYHNLDLHPPSYPSALLQGNYCHWYLPHTLNFSSFIQASYWAFPCLLPLVSQHCWVFSSCTLPDFQGKEWWKVSLLSLPLLNCSTDAVSAPALQCAVTHCSGNSEIRPTG